MLKELPSIALVFLAKLFSAILMLGYYPQLWKKSQIIMVAKPGKDATLPSSYRPISLLPCLSKLFEKVLLSKITPFLHQNDIIPTHQFGFREKHGTIEQVNRITNEIRKAFEMREYCSAVFLDVAQAFDKVWYDGLIHKIKKSLPNTFHNILESYLSNRRFTVKVNDYITEECPITAGVPQGSVLGPILYILFTADIPTSDEVITSTFADDTAILSRHKCPITATKVLQQHLKQIEEWLAKWRIKVNENKCKHITFTLRPKTCPTVKLNNVSIPQADEITYLGIHLDRRLTWRRHIAAKKLQLKLKSASLHWLLNKKSGLSLSNKVLLYNAIIKPIWMYGIQLWGTACATNIDIIQRFQSKTLRVITGAPWYMRNENIHRDLNIPTIKEEIEIAAKKYLTKLRNHPNPLANTLAHATSQTRLRRRDKAAF